MNFIGMMHKSSKLQQAEGFSLFPTAELFMDKGVESIWLA
jgi:hypothetical protein